MKGDLEIGEPHPSALDALRWIKKMPLSELMLWQESFSSNAIEGNRLGEVCSKTLERLMNKQSVSDRYILGLAWVMRYREGVK